MNNNNNNTEIEEIIEQGQAPKLPDTAVALPDQNEAHELQDQNEAHELQDQNEAHELQDEHDDIAEEAKNPS